MAVTRRRFVVTTLVSAVALPRFAALAQPADSLSRLGKLRDIVAAMPPQSWRNVSPSTTAIATVTPPLEKVPFRGATNGFGAILDSWTGAAYDPMGHKIYFWGGGHTDYGGNEVYCLDLELLKITRLTDPSPLSPGVPGSSCPNAGMPSDGTPSSSHTYDGTVWCPLTNTFWSWPTIGYCPSPGILSVGVSGQCWEFNPATKKWSAEPTLMSPNGKTPAWGDAGSYIVKWVPPHKKFVIVAGGMANSFDPIAKTYSGWTGTSFSMGEGCGTYVSDLDEVWGCSSAGDSTAIWKLGFAPNGAPATAPQVVLPPGRTPREFYGGIGFQYDPGNKKIIVWSGSGVIWTFDPKTLAYQYIPAPAGPVPSGTPRIYNKFDYVAELACFAAYNDIHQGLWVWKPGDLSKMAAYVPPGPSFIVQNADGSGAVPYADFQSAAHSLKDGQTLHIRKNPTTLGHWVDGAIITASHCTISGDLDPEGAPATKIQAALVDGGKACIVLKGNDTTVVGLEIFGAVGDGSANAIRLEGKNLTVRHCYLHHNQMNILCGDPGGDILVEDTTLADSVGGESYAHNIYVSANADGTASSLTVRRCKSLRANGQGHLIKSRALKTTIENCVIAMMDGQSSRCIDVPDGGVVLIRDNVIQQGIHSDNEDFIGVARELFGNSTSIAPMGMVALRGADGKWVPDGKTWPNNVIGYKPDPVRVHSTHIENNVFISDCEAYPNSAPPIVMVSASSPAPVVLRNNTLVSNLRLATIAAPYPASTFDDDGSNKIIVGRAAASYQPYPWLPSPR
jgi:hypothetical protein